VGEQRHPVTGDREPREEQRKAIQIDDVNTQPVSGDQRLLTAWFAIRGIGSIYYLMFALNHGLSGRLSDQAINITLSAVAASIILHGISLTPLMSLYARRQAGKSRRSRSENRRHEIR